MGQREDLLGMVFEDRMNGSHDPVVELLHLGVHFFEDFYKIGFLDIFKNNGLVKFFGFFPIMFL